MKWTDKSGVRVALLVAVTLLAACDDDPSPPSDGPWQAVPLQGMPQHGILFGIASSSYGALAVGTATEGLSTSARNTPLLAAPDENGNWRRDSPSWLPAEGILTAVGYSGGGSAIIGGAILGAAPDAFVLDERDGWNLLGIPLAPLAFAGSGEVLRLAGSYVGTAGVLISTAADVWRLESLPFPSTGGQERGLVDIDARAGTWVACGFDDGAEGTAESPGSVLFRNDGNGWELLDTPCGGCSNREFRAVAISAAGGILVGGTLTDYGAGAEDPEVAFLLVGSAGGDWVEIVLPDAGQLDRVNDILVAADRTIYLACGGAGPACILRSPTGGPASCELTLTGARIEQLAEAPDGTILAVGATFDAAHPEIVMPALWRRVE